MTDNFFDFVISNDNATFLRSQEFVMKHAEYAPYSRDLDKMNKLLEQGEYDKVIRYDNVNVLLSPAAHLMKSFCQKKVQDEKGSKAEMIVAHRIMEHISLTGDGSKEKPYLVTRVDDEREVLSFLGEHFRSQELVQGENGMYDVIGTVSGKNIYFDITPCYLKMQNTSPDTLMKMLRDELGEMKEKKKPWWKFW